jgi:hypothetical protein
VNIQYYSDRDMEVDCRCSHLPSSEDGDSCPHIPQRMPSLDLLEPFRANIKTLNIRYLRDPGLNVGTMDDILNTPFFQQSLPNLESLRWSCHHFDVVSPPFPLPLELFASSLPRLRRLEMDNCWGSFADTPVLKVVLAKCTFRVRSNVISSNQLVEWLRLQQPLVSLSLNNFSIPLDPHHAVHPVSMENLKELTLKSVDSWIMSDCLRCPSVGMVTTLRIANFILWEWPYIWSVSVTATNDSGGSASTSVSPGDDSALGRAWLELSTMLSHRVTVLEVEDLQSVMNTNRTAAVPVLIDTLPDLCVIRVQLQAVAESCEVLRRVLSGTRGIRRVERLVGKGESPEEVRRNDERWKELGVEDQIHDLLA